MWAIKAVNPEKSSGKKKLTNLECFCKQFKPLLFICQFIGIIPLIRKCSVSRSGNRFDCVLERKLLSYPFIASIVFLILLIYVTFWSDRLLKVVLGAQFHGTDLYAYRIELGVLLFQNVSILALTFLFQSRLKTLWNSLRNVAAEIDPYIVFPKRVRNYCISLSICTILCGLSFGIFSAGLAARMCFKSSVDILSKCFAGGEIMFYFSVLAISFASFYHWTFSSLNFIFSVVVESLHEKLVGNLEHVLSSLSSGSPQTGTEIEGIRILHAKICRCADNLSMYFGLPSLTICCSSIVSIICGIYWIILFRENLNVQDRNMLGHLLMFATQMYFSGAVLLLILLSGHFISRSSLKAGVLLNNAKTSHLDLTNQIQVSLFLNKISGFPSRFSVHTIVTIGLSFLSSASTNVVTYILVLMQFRLDANVRCVDKELFTDTIESANRTITL